MDQALHSSVKQQDKGQQAETDAQEVPPEYEEGLHFEVKTQWNRLPREVVESSLVEIFKSCVNEILCNVLWDDPA
ncbi:hypothetical protein WISP_56433 [Willisornis vidua]|uniref:Uncharacterized protein n=1 Tax=Willisornis vidua TaxID=1566151 RepID=A0ABQ9DDE9_9PASS|nr:hypothetical protein WISP_56433 [Willisornis vidua]